MPQCHCIWNLAEVQSKDKVTHVFINLLSTTSKSAEFQVYYLNIASSALGISFQGTLYFCFCLCICHWFDLVGAQWEKGDFNFYCCVCSHGYSVLPRAFSRG